MNNWQEFFKNKKVTVMGLGLLGRSIGDIRFLAEMGAQEIIVTDTKTPEQLHESIEKLKDLKNIKYVLGEHRLEDFRDKDFILKSAGVYLDSPFIEEAYKHNVPVEMSTALFAAFTPATVVGITGTRGKSTVTHLIYEILTKALTTPASRPPLLSKEGSKVFLGGNVKGVSTLPMLRDAKLGDIAVLELDSWQLQGFGARKISPHFSVFTTFMPDHMNYYKNDLAVYLDDKAQIFKYQTPDNVLVLGSQIEQKVKEIYGNVIQSKVVTADQNLVPQDWQVQIPGEHNRYNISLAVALTRTMGIEDSVIKKVVGEFKAVPGRLELVREYKGIKIYNDTTSTTPDAAIVALKALDKNIVLIMGGADKDLDMNLFLEEINKRVKSVIVLPGTGIDRIRQDIQEKVNVLVTEVTSMQEAVEKAVGSAEMGDSIVLSPGFASFGLFKNEFDRGAQFNSIVAAL